MHTWVFCLYVCLCNAHPQRPEGIICPGTGVTTELCELLCGCWESNPGLLKEERVLITTEPSLQSLCTGSVRFCVRQPRPVQKTASPHSSPSTLTVLTEDWAPSEFPEPRCGGRNMNACPIGVALLGGVTLLESLCHACLEAALLSP